MKIQVLGTGCPKCQKLAEVAADAAKSLGLDYSLEKVTEISRFAEFGVMFTPALVVDGKVRVSGRVPPVDEVKKLLA